MDVILKWLLLVKFCWKVVNQHIISLCEIKVDKTNQLYNEQLSRYLSTYECAIGWQCDENVYLII